MTRLLSLFVLHEFKPTTYYLLQENWGVEGSELYPTATVLWKELDYLDGYHALSIKRSVHLTLFDLFIVSRLYCYSVPLSVRDRSHLQTLQPCLFPFLFYYLSKEKQILHYTGIIHRLLFAHVGGRYQYILRTSSASDYYKRKSSFRLVLLLVLQKAN